MARKKKHPEHVNHERWLVSYADFITLLFATFVMLFAMSNVEKAKVVAAADSMNKAFGGSDSGGGASSSILTPHVAIDGQASSNASLNIMIMPTASQNQSAASKAGDTPPDDSDDPSKAGGKGDGKADTATPTPKPDTKSESATPTPTPTTGGGNPAIGQTEGKMNSQLVAKLKQLLADFGLKNTEAREEQRGTVISLGAAAFFKEGEIEVKPESTHQLDKIVNALRDQNFDIRIEGHTDNTPIHSGRYTSNMDLSSQRASRIYDFMIKQYNYPPELLSTSGYGETKPIADNATPEGREKNRRIDIVILNQHAMANEPKATPQTKTDPATH